MIVQTSFIINCNSLTVEYKCCKEALNETLIKMIMEKTLQQLEYIYNTVIGYFKPFLVLLNSTNYIC